MPEPEGSTECVDLFVLLVLEGDFGSATAAFSSFHKTASLAQMDVTPRILKYGMAISLSFKARC